MKLSIDFILDKPKIVLCIPLNWPKYIFFGRLSHNHLCRSNFPDNRLSAFHISHHIFHMLSDMFCCNPIFHLNNTFSLDSELFDMPPLYYRYIHFVDYEQNQACNNILHYIWCLLWCKVLPKLHMLSDMQIHMCKIHYCHYKFLIKLYY